MNAAPGADPDRCPRCGAAFACGAAEPGPCACSGVNLAPALLAALRERYPARCLCLDCLRALAQPGLPAPAAPR